MYVCVCVCAYPIPPQCTGYDTGSIFESITWGLNYFFFPKPVGNRSL